MIISHFVGAGSVRQLEAKYEREAAWPNFPLQSVAYLFPSNNLFSLCRFILLSNSWVQILRTQRMPLITHQIGFLIEQSSCVIGESKEVGVIVTDRWRPTKVKLIKVSYNNNFFIWYDPSNSAMRFRESTIWRAGFDITSVENNLNKNMEQEFILILLLQIPCHQRFCNVGDKWWSPTI